MSLTSKYSVINIRRYLKNDNPKIGEDRLLQVLSGFSCPKNPDLELFLKNSSIDLQRKTSLLHILFFLRKTEHCLGILR